MTRLVALLGDPVAHSLSPGMQNAAFEALELDLRYLAFRVEAARFAEALGGLAALEAVGTNVTVPHKERAFALVEAHTSEAACCGAVNVVTFHGGRTVGHNTDVVGIRSALALLDAKQGSALLLGAGGAARAAAVVLVEQGFSPLHIAVRDLQKGQRFAEDLTVRRPQTAVELHPLDALPGGCALVVNATTLGLPGNPFPPSLLQDVLAAGGVGGTVLDLVYAPGGTPLATAATERGLRALDGTDVLLEQGAASFTLFTGRPAPLDVMATALGRHVATRFPS